MADTQGLVQDTNNDRLPQGLPDLVLQFKLFPSVYSRRKRSWRGGLVFLGAHDAGNDAIANLKLWTDFNLDSLFFYNDDDDHAYIADVDDLRAVYHWIDEWLRKVMHNKNPNLFIMCFDAEGVEGTPLEYGFTWHRTSNVMSIVQKEKGQRWWSKLKAKHFLVKEFKDHPTGWSDIVACHLSHCLTKERIFADFTICHDRIHHFSYLTAGLHESHIRQQTINGNSKIPADCTLVGLISRYEQRTYWFLCRVEMHHLGTLTFQKDSPGRKCHVSPRAKKRKSVLINMAYELKSNDLREDDHVLTPMGVAVNKPARL